METMEALPFYIPLLFGLTVLATIIWFSIATRSKFTFLLALGWALLQSVLGVLNVFQDTTSLPPRIMLFGVFPAVLFIIFIFLSPWGRKYIGRINLKSLTCFHLIRVPVEIVLVLLYHQGAVSVYMTLEGTNFDLLSGLTAPLAAYFSFRKHRVRKNLLLLWNILCLLLLLNVVVTAIFALPSPFQQIAFDQPNIAVLHFPYNLLPSLIVPMVFFAHLAAIWRLAAKHET